MNCPHWFSQSCAIAGQLAGTDYVPVAPPECGRCGAGDTPRQVNRVTAALALRWVRAHRPQHLPQARLRLRPLLDCPTCYG